jgi:hypothetical protein
MFDHPIDLELTSKTREHRRLHIKRLQTADRCSPLSVLSSPCFHCGYSLILEWWCSHRNTLAVSPRGKEFAMGCRRASPTPLLVVILAVVLLLTLDRPVAHARHCECSCSSSLLAYRVRCLFGVRGVHCVHFSLYLSGLPPALCLIQLLPYSFLQ